MPRHIKSCAARKKALASEPVGRKKDGYFMILLRSRYDTGHWLLIEIPASFTLLDLDEFIRDIWVECCGHMSRFMINGVEYSSRSYHDPSWGRECKSEDNAKLRNVLAVGMDFIYEYDFGSTTELLLSVKDYREGPAMKDPDVVILSRNIPIIPPCDHCGKPSELIIQWGYFDDKYQFLCEKCYQELSGEDEEDSESDDFFGNEGTLPLVNSPRCGVCGYTGSTIYSDEFQPDVAPVPKGTKPPKKAPSAKEPKE